MPISRFGVILLPVLVAVPVAACGSADGPADPSLEDSVSSTAALASPPNVQKPQASGGEAVAASSTSFTDHGGPVMTGSPNKLYYIWYGTWSGNTAANAILTDYANNIGGTTWFDMNTLYSDSSGNHIPNSMGYGGAYTDSGSQGTNLSSSGTVAAVVSHAITASGTHLPNDPNGIYVVFAGSNITTQSSCGFCAYHTYTTVGSTTIKFALVPDPTVICSTGCLSGYPSPNNDAAADAMANSLSHEMSETLTDPTASGWYGSSSSSDEDGDRCNFDFGTMYTASGCSSACANTKVGTRDFLLQELWLPLGPTTGVCANRYLRNNDIVWRNNTTGDVVTQHGDGASTPTFKLTSTVPTNWAIVGRGDFDGDGNDDWLWRDTAGDVSVWLMNGTTPISGTTIATALSLVWTTIGVADFDGDGKNDILWRNTSTGDVVMWFMNGTTVTSSVTVYSALPLAWTTSGTGDFNGDGKGDILWRNTSTGDVYIWEMNGSTAVTSGTVDAGLSSVWQIIGRPGDFDGDGKSDVLLQNTSTKDVSIWLMNGLTIKSVGTPKAAFTGYELIGVGDFDGNGKADIMWRNTSTEDLQTWRMNGTAIAGTFTPLKASNPALVTNGTYGDQNP